MKVYRSLIQVLCFKSIPDRITIKKGRDIIKNSMKGLFFLIFFGSAMFLFVVLSHMRPLFEKEIDLIARGLFLLLLILSAIFASKREELKITQPVFIAFAIALIAMTADLYLPTSKILLAALNVDIQTPIGITLDKLDSTFILVAIILLLSRIAKNSLSDLYLHSEKPLDLKFGIIAFGICVLGAIPMAQLFGAQNLTFGRIVPWIPFILIFVFANALNEELLFRALFLKKLHPIFGRMMSNLLLVIPFVLHHTGVDYSQNTLMLFAFLLPLAITWGWLTQKSGSIWNSVLFHAGTDLPIILVLLSRIQ